MQQGPPRQQNGLAGPLPGAGLRTGASPFVRPAAGQSMTPRGPAPNAQQPQQVLPPMEIELFFNDQIVKFRT
jgi:hypothetical protein